MPTCQYNRVCGLSDEADPEAQSCILHSENPDKDTQVFSKALDIHRKKKGDDFRFMVFPELVDFSGATFSGETDFSEARFSGEAYFAGAEFFGKANFGMVEFSEGADFVAATFSEYANFDWATFAEPTSFGNARFSKWASFGSATFSNLATFETVTFSKGADFGNAKFSGETSFCHATTFCELAYFCDATFSEWAYFRAAKFSKLANFGGATFSGGAEFGYAMFSGEVNFGGATFSEGVNFSLAEFAKETEVNFQDCQFRGRTIFTNLYTSSQEDPLEEGDKQTIAIFTEAQTVDFQDVIIDPPDGLTFVRADMRRCRFLGTDLRKVQMVGVKWPEKGHRIVVYDEIASLDEGETRQWEAIEHLYRQLKQNYEDQRDYRRAGDFHYGEKEMQRQNADTPRGIRMLLRFYWIISGYGERISRPFVWVGILFVLSTFVYLGWGLGPPPKQGHAASAPLALNSVWDWLTAAHYSFRVMAFLKPTDLVPLVGVTKFVHTIQSLLGPLLLGLGALAIRQRLRR